MTSAGGPVVAAADAADISRLASVQRAHAIETRGVTLTYAAPICSSAFYVSMCTFVLVKASK